MKYMLLIRQGSNPTPNAPEEWAKLSAAEQPAVYSAYMAINQTPGVTPGQQMQLPELATTVRVKDGKTLTTDGPFAEIKEALGGYLFFEADDLDAAIELAARIPAASTRPHWSRKTCCGASVERPKRMPPTAARWRWCRTTPNGGCSSGGWRSGTADEDGPKNPCPKTDDGVHRAEGVGRRQAD